MSLGRRRFLGISAAAAASLAAPSVCGQTRPRVVVVGGGAGGATAARFLAEDSRGAIEVTLVEPERSYTTCFFSNHALGGFKPLDELVHGYDRLAADFGIRLVHDRAGAIDRDARMVRLAGGGALPYDRLILSPGIDFIPGAVEGWDLSAGTRMPHAYRGGPQVAHLAAQIAAMPAGGLFVLIAPPDPYRCPPGPYERVSMVAHHFRARNPTAKILIADPKPQFSKMALFQEGWADRYRGMIDRIGPEFGGGNVSVDPAAMTVTIDGEAMRADVCNVIPAMRAGRIAREADLADGDWVPIDPADMRARADPAIHVLGDAADAGDMPKSAFAANRQARHCAAAVLAEMTGVPPPPATYESVCWSLIDDRDAVKVGATYAATQEKIAKTHIFMSETGESAATRRENHAESLGWYAQITAEMFG